jgi:hypothetical protein
MPSPDASAARLLLAASWLRSASSIADRKLQGQADRHGESQGTPCTAYCLVMRAACRQLGN